MIAVFKELFLVLMFHCCRKYPIIYCGNGLADVFICTFISWNWCLHVFLLCPNFLLLAGLCSLWLEPEQHAHSRAVSPCSHQCRHLWHEGALAVCRNVLLLFLLAYWRPLELFHQLPALVWAVLCASTFHCPICFRKFVFLSASALSLHMKSWTCRVCLAVADWIQMLFKAL